MNAINVLEECRNAARIGIGGHIRPDGDCVGSCLALYQYLVKCFPEITVKVFLEKPADIFRSIKGFEEIHSIFGEEEAFDVFFALDCGAERLGGSVKYFCKAEKAIKKLPRANNIRINDDVLEAFKAAFGESNVRITQSILKN